MAKSGGSRGNGSLAVKREASNLVLPQKRNGRATSSSSNKKLKINGNHKDGLPEHEERLARAIADFNLSVNELFQLKEYLSIISWNPSDFSKYLNTRSQLPENYNFFISNNDYLLKWSNEDEDLDSLPLRLQKKVIAEREAKILEKYPLKDQVVNRGIEIEKQILNSLIDHESSESEEVEVKEPSRPQRRKPGPKPKQKSEPIEADDDNESEEHSEEDDEEEEEEEDEEEQPRSRRGNYRASSRSIRGKRAKITSPVSRRRGSYRKSKKEVAEHEIDNESELSEEDPGTNYKVTFKYSIPPQKITHPSHIPSWSPDQSQENTINEETLHAHENDLITDPIDEKQNKIIDFHPKPIQVIAKPPDSISAPEVEDRIANFLNNNYRFAIIDEANTLDYNNTPEEYERIMDQQKHLLKRLYEKVMVEQRFELNGDKIERRKTVIPHTSNTKLIQDPFRETGTLSPRIQGAANNLTHNDYLINQGMAFSGIHQQIRKQHQLRTRKVAQMIEQHFKKKKGEKDRLIREREQNLKKISRIAIQAVKKRWGQAQKVYRYLQLQKEEELKKIKGREHLSQMLEHSTQLLEAQLHKSTSKENSQSPQIENSDNEEENSDSSDNMSSSSSSDESNDDEKSDLSGKEDINLTIEELKKKYANLESSVGPSSSAAEDSNDDRNVNGIQNGRTSDDHYSDSDSDDGSSVDENAGLSAIYGKDTIPKEATPLESILEFTDEQKKRIEELNREEGTNPVLDSDSASDSGSESDMESEDQDAGSNSDVSESEENSKSGLASLVSNGAIDSDEDADMSSADLNEASEEDEHMTTTDEEDEPTTPKSHSPLPVEKEPESEAAEEEINGTRVKDVPVPSLLRGTLRPYQKQGLNWLASLYNNNTNGILADEMGLGKTIQTISLLAYLACEHHIWGPHLIVVPTSVMLNWEMEFKKFAPGFKVLTYYGSPQQRAQKRKGWNKPDAFHICITSYQLVVHDHQSFKRRKWRYMILDEAHNIKNFRSTRWRALLNFNTENRLLLTGTPLQNNLMELWSLLYFLMPSSKVSQAMPDGFANLEDFQTWFGRPVDKILEQTSAGGGDVIDDASSTSKMDLETKNTVSRLHQVLRPYLLRRLKKDVEQQMPGKYEHIVYCRLSKRQRYLYDDFMSRAKTKETLASGNFLSIINCLMQLRKVCNHPDLFEVRPIVTSFAMPTSAVTSYGSNETLVRKLLAGKDYESKVSLETLNLDISHKDHINYFVSQSTNKLKASSSFEKQIEELDKLLIPGDFSKKPDLDNYLEYYKFIKADNQNEIRSKLNHILYLNTLRCDRGPLYGEKLIGMLQQASLKKDRVADLPPGLILNLDERIECLSDTIDKYSILTPTAVALDMKDQLIPVSTQYRIMEEVSNHKIDNPFHKSQVKLSIAFPDKSLLQYDCGKLQKLASLLQDLTSKGHRALIFTQMTKVLDILEQFLNIHGYRYMRLDGATKIEDRQLLTEKFNRDNKIPVFILSTRSGGLGINLTGADTVIFYDSDWNPAMDKQCQDRCHRIGQSRDVHIYRFVSEYTIESNILRKANQKRQLDNVVIQEGEFTTDYFGKFSVKDLVNDTDIVGDLPDKPIAENSNMESLAQAEDEEDRAAANLAMKEVQVDDEDFEEENKAPTAEGSTSQTPRNEGTPTPVNHGPKENIEDADYEEGVGHIDEYMLRFIADGYYWD